MQYFVELVTLNNTSTEVTPDNENPKTEKIWTSCTSLENENEPGLRFRRKLYMTRRTNIILNINAAILIAVFVFLYAYFA